MGKSSLQSDKIFVLDTSVILHDHAAFRSFQEHDVAVPIQVLEELDHFKTGNDSRSFEARSFIRVIDTISSDRLISEWLPLGGQNGGRFKIILGSTSTGLNAVKIFGDAKYDHLI